MFFFNSSYFLFVLLPVLAITLLAQWWVKSAFQKASQIPNMQRITGAQAARRLLDSAGLNYVRIEPTRSMNMQMMPTMQPGRGMQPRQATAASPSLDDHYDPRDKVLRLSPEVYSGTSVGALGVAAHETGHAVQDAQAYVPMRARASIVGVANIGTNIAWIFLLLGIFMNISGLAWLGVLAFATGTLFAFLTLPVELNASSRAMQMLTANGLVDRTEYGQARSVLNAAAFTYIAGLLASILNLLYYVMLASGTGRRR